MDFPKTIGDNNMKINIIFYSFLFFLFSCKVEKDSNCNVLLRKAKENLNKKGIRTNIGIPGTGISYSKFHPNNPLLPEFF